ncbi:MAG: hypothetical protein P9M03_03065 [Candidatus Theseobacter exili]|nr:hypothetical protein [Candidatus Theseobacter exili]
MGYNSPDVRWGYFDGEPYLFTKFIPKAKDASAETVKRLAPGSLVTTMALYSEEEMRQIDRNLGGYLYEPQANRLHLLDFGGREENNKETSYRRLWSSGLLDPKQGREQFAQELSDFESRSSDPAIMEELQRSLASIGVRGHALKLATRTLQERIQTVGSRVDVLFEDIETSYPSWQFLSYEEWERSIAMARKLKSQGPFTDTNGDLVKVASVSIVDDPSAPLAKLETVEVSHEEHQGQRRKVLTQTMVVNAQYFRNMVLLRTIYPEIVSFDPEDQSNYMQAMAGISTNALNRIIVETLNGTSVPMINQYSIVEDSMSSLVGPSSAKLSSQQKQVFEQGPSPAKVSLMLENIADSLPEPGEPGFEEGLTAASEKADFIITVAMQGKTSAEATAFLAKVHIPTYFLSTVLKNTAVADKSQLPYLIEGDPTQKALLLVKAKNLIESLKNLDATDIPLINGSQAADLAALSQVLGLSLNSFIKAAHSPLSDVSHFTAALNMAEAAYGLLQMKQEGQDFTVEDVLGYGTFGVALKVTLKKPMENYGIGPFAVKVFFETQSRLHAEILKRALFNKNIPGVVPVIKTFDFEDQTVQLQPMADTRARAFDKMHSLFSTTSLPEAFNIAMGFAGTFRDFHNAGTFHGDLHEGNILVAGDGYTEIIDWDGTFFAPEIIQPILDDIIADLAEKGEKNGGTLSPEDQQLSDLVANVLRNPELLKEEVGLVDASRTAVQFDDVSDLMRYLYKIMGGTLAPTEMPSSRQMKQLLVDRLLEEVPTHPQLLAPCFDAVKNFSKLVDMACDNSVTEKTNSAQIYNELQSVFTAFSALNIQGISSLSKKLEPMFGKRLADKWADEIFYMDSHAGFKLLQYMGDLEKQGASAKDPKTFTKAFAYALAFRRDPVNPGPVIEPAVRFSLDALLVTARGEGEARVRLASLLSPVFGQGYSTYLADKFFTTDIATGEKILQEMEKLIQQNSDRFTAFTQAFYTTLQTTPQEKHSGLWAVVSEIEMKPTVPDDGEITQEIFIGPAGTSKFPSAMKHIGKRPLSEIAAIKRTESLPNIESTSFPTRTGLSNTENQSFEARIHRMYEASATKWKDNEDYVRKLMNYNSSDSITLIPRVVHLSKEDKKKMGLSMEDPAQHFFVQGKNPQERFVYIIVQLDELVKTENVRSARLVKEALFHEAREAFWRSQLHHTEFRFFDPIEAHRIASAEQAQEFGTVGLLGRTRITYYHQREIEKMSKEQLIEIVRETADLRAEHHTLIQEANDIRKTQGKVARTDNEEGVLPGNAIKTTKIKQYEKGLRQVAFERLEQEFPKTAANLWEEMGQGEKLTSADLFFTGMIEAFAGAALPTAFLTFGIGPAMLGIIAGIALPTILILTPLFARILARLPLITRRIQGSLHKWKLREEVGPSKREISEKTKAIWASFGKGFLDYKLVIIIGLLKILLPFILPGTVVPIVAGLMAAGIIILVKQVFTRTRLYSNLQKMKEKLLKDWKFARILATPVEDLLRPVFQTLLPRQLAFLADAIWGPEFAPNLGSSDGTQTAGTEERKTRRERQKEFWNKFGGMFPIIVASITGIIPLVLSAMAQSYFAAPIVVGSLTIIAGVTSSFLIPSLVIMLVTGAAKLRKILPELTAGIRERLPEYTEKIRIFSIRAIEGFSLKVLRMQPAAPDLAARLMREITHEEQNDWLRKKLLEGSVVGFLRGKGPQHQQLQQRQKRGFFGTKIVETLEETPVSDEGQALLALQSKTDNIFEALDRISNNDIPADLQEFMDDFMLRNGLSTREMKKMMELLLKSRIQVLKDEFFVFSDTTDNTYGISHAGRGVHFGNPRIWLGEEAVRTLPENALIRIALEEGLHMIRPMGKHLVPEEGKPLPPKFKNRGIFKEIVHDWDSAEQFAEFLKAAMIEKRGTQAMKIPGRPSSTTEDTSPITFTTTDYEVLKASPVQETRVLPDGRIVRILSVSPNLMSRPAFHFPFKDAKNDIDEEIIVVREDVPSIVDEAIFHDLNEAFWMTVINPETNEPFTQRDAHIIASAMQAHEFGGRTLTPFHISAITGMRKAELDTIINEFKDKSREYHEKVLILANKAIEEQRLKQRPISLDSYHRYEKAFFDFAVFEKDFLSRTEVAEKDRERLPEEQTKRWAATMLAMAEQEIETGYTGVIRATQHLQRAQEILSEHPSETLQKEASAVSERIQEHKIEWPDVLNLIESDEIPYIDAPISKDNLQVLALSLKKSFTEGKGFLVKDIAMLKTALKQKNLNLQDFVSEYKDFSPHDSDILHAAAFMMLGMDNLKASERLGKDFEFVKFAGLGGNAVVAHIIITDKKLIEKYGTQELAVKIYFDPAESSFSKRETRYNYNKLFLYNENIPGIIPAIDMFQSENGMLFKILPFLPEATSIDDSLGSDGVIGKMPMSERIRRASELAGTVQKMHQAGVAHDDLDGNVLVEKNGHLFVMDFDQTTYSKQKAAKTFPDFRLNNLHTESDRRDLTTIVLSLISNKPQAELLIETQSKESLAEALFEEWKASEGQDFHPGALITAKPFFAEFAKKVFASKNGKENTDVLLQNLQKLNSSLKALSFPVFSSIMTPDSPETTFVGPIGLQEYKTLDNVLRSIQSDPKQQLSEEELLLFRGMLKRAGLILADFLPKDKEIDHITFYKSMRTALSLARGLSSLSEKNRTAAAKHLSKIFWKMEEKLPLAEVVTISIEAATAQEVTDWPSRLFQFQRVLLEDDKLFSLIQSDFDMIGFLQLLPFDNEDVESAEIHDDFYFLVENRDLPLRDLLLRIQERENAPENPFKNEKSAQLLKQLAVMSRMTIAENTSVPPLAVLYLANNLADQIINERIVEEHLVLEGNTLVPINGGDEGESIVDFNKLTLGDVSIGTYFARDTDEYETGYDFNHEMLLYGLDNNMLYNLEGLIVGNLPAEDEEGQSISSNHILSNFFKRHMSNAVAASLLTTRRRGRLNAFNYAKQFARRRYEKDRALVEQSTWQARYARFINLLTSVASKNTPALIDLKKSATEILLRMDVSQETIDSMTSGQIILTVLKRGFSSRIRQSGLLADLIKRLKPESRSVQFFINGMKALNDYILGMTLANEVQKRFYEIHRKMFENILGHSETNSTFKSIGFAENCKARTVTKLARGLYLADGVFYSVQPPLFEGDLLVSEVDEAFVISKLNEKPRINIENEEDFKKYIEDAVQSSSFDTVEKASAQMQKVLQDWSTNLVYSHDLFKKVYYTAPDANGLIEEDIFFNDPEDGAILEFALVNKDLPFSTIIKPVSEFEKPVWISGRASLQLSKPKQSLNDEQIRENLALWNRNKSREDAFHLSVRAGISSGPISNDVVTDPEKALKTDEKGKPIHEKSINLQVQALVEASVQGRIQSLFHAAGARFEDRFISKVMDDTSVFSNILNSMQSRLWGRNDAPGEELTVNGQQILFSSDALEIIRKGKTDKLHKKIFGTEKTSRPQVVQVNRVLQAAERFFMDKAEAVGYLSSSTTEDYDFDAFKKYLSKNVYNYSALSEENLLGLYEFALVKRMFDYHEVLDDFTIPRNPLEKLGEIGGEETTGLINADLIDTILKASRVQQKIDDADADTDVSSLIKELSEMGLSDILMQDPRNPGMDSSLSYSLKIEEGTRKFETTRQQYFVGYADLRAFAEMNHWHYEAFLQEMMDKPLKNPRPETGDSNFDAKMEAHLAEIHDLFHHNFRFDLISDAIKRQVKNRIAQNIEGRKLQLIIQAAVLQGNKRALKVLRESLPESLQKQLDALIDLAAKNPRGPPLGQILEYLDRVIAETEEQPKTIISKIMASPVLSNKRFIIFNDELHFPHKDEQGFSLQELFSETALREGGDEIYFSGPLITNELLMSFTEFRGINDVPGITDATARLRVIAADPSSLSFHGKADVRSHLAMALVEGRMTDTSKKDIEAPNPGKKAMFVRRHTYSEKGDQEIKLFKSLDYPEDTVGISASLDKEGESIGTATFSPESLERIKEYLDFLGYPKDETLKRPEETARNAAALIIKVQNGTLAAFEVEEIIRSNHTLLRFFGISPENPPSAPIYPVLEMMINQIQLYERLKNRPREEALSDWPGYVQELQNALQKMSPHLPISTLQRLVMELPDYAVSETDREQFRILRRMLYRIFEQKTRNNTFAAKALVRQALVAGWFAKKPEEIGKKEPNRSFIPTDPDLFHDELMNELIARLTVEHGNLVTIFRETDPQKIVNVKKTMGWLFTEEQIMDIFGPALADELFPRTIVSKDITIGEVDPDIVSGRIIELVEKAEEQFNEKYRGDSSESTRLDDPSFMESNPIVETRKALIVNGKAIKDADGNKTGFKEYFEANQENLSADALRAIDTLAKIEQIIKQKIKSLEIGRAPPDTALIDQYKAFLDNFRNTRFVLERNKMFLHMKDPENAAAMSAGKDTQSIYIGKRLFDKLAGSYPEALTAGVFHELAHVFPPTNGEKTRSTLSGFSREANETLMRVLPDIAREEADSQAIVRESLLMEPAQTAMFLGEILEIADKDDSDQITPLLSPEQRGSLFQQGLFNKLFSKYNLLLLPLEASRIIDRNTVQKWIEEDPELVLRALIRAKAFTPDILRRLSPTTADTLGQYIITANMQDADILQTRPLTVALKTVEALPVRDEDKGLIIETLKNFNAAVSDSAADTSWLSVILASRMAQQNKTYSSLPPPSDFTDNLAGLSDLRQDFFTMLSSKYVKSSQEELKRYATLARYLPESEIIASMVACSQRTVEDLVADVPKEQRTRGYIILDPKYFSRAAVPETNLQTYEEYLKNLLEDLENMKNDPNTTLIMLDELPKDKDIPERFRKEVRSLVRFFDKKHQEWPEPDGTNSIFLMTKSSYADTQEFDGFPSAAMMVFDKDANTGLSMVRQALPVAQGILAAGGIEGIGSDLNPELAKAIRDLYASVYSEAWGKELDKTIPLDEILLNPERFLIPPVSKDRLNKINNIVDSLSAFDKMA